LKTLSIFELLTSGGLAGNIIMAHGACFYVFAFEQRQSMLHQNRRYGTNKRNIKNGRIDNAKKCAHSKSPVARLIEKGISRIGKPLEDINTAIENAGKWKFINLKRM
jgi:biopolymer transport protein ExbB